MKRLAAAIAIITLTLAAQLGTPHSVRAATNSRALVVRVDASWCPACRATQATFNKVKAEFGNRVTFVDLDVSDEHSAELSRALAKRFGILDFYEAHRTETSTVAVIDPKTHQVIGSLFNDNNLGDYEQLINKAVSK